MKQKKSEQKKSGFDSKQKPEEQPQKQLSIDFENLKILGGDSLENIYIQGYCNREVCTMSVYYGLFQEMLKHYIKNKINHNQMKGQRIERNIIHGMMQIEAEYCDECEIPFYEIRSFLPFLNLIYQMN